MSIIKSLKTRRSIYEMDDNIEISEELLTNRIEEITRLVPDAFNNKSQYVVIFFGNKHKELWDNIYNVFEGKVSKEKIDIFRNGAGTILFFYDSSKVEKLEKEFPLYKNSFKPWALQSNGMLQINIWTELSTIGIGANLQHYNPIIDDMIYNKYNIDKKYILLAQMVFGNPLGNPREKETEDILKRVKVIK